MMKRLFLLITIVVISISAAQAAAPYASSSSQPTRPLLKLTLNRGGVPQGLSSLSRSMRELRKVTTLKTRALIKRYSGKAFPLSESFASLLTTATDLALPASILSGQTYVQDVVGPNQGNWSNFHQTWAGYQTGDEAAISFEPIMTLAYRGSVFSDGNAASTYGHEGINYVAAASTQAPSDCSNVINSYCQIGGFISSQGHLNIYQVGVINSCVIETGGVGDPDLINQNVDSVSKALAAVFLTGVQEAQAACPAASPPKVITNTPTNTPTSTPTLTPTTTPTATATATEPPPVLVLNLTVKGSLHAHHKGSIRVSVDEGPQGASDGSRTGEVRAHVTGAKVTVDGRKAGLSKVLHGNTGASGSITFKKLRPSKAGSITVTASKSGFASVSTKVRVGS